MGAVKGVIFDYGGTLDSCGEHWSHVIRRGYSAAGLEPDEDCFREAYVYGERALAATRHILPHHTFLDLMRIKIRIELECIARNDSLCMGKIGESSAETIAEYCYRSAEKCVSESAQTLKKLYAAGIPMVLVSNFYGNVRSVLGDFGIESYFDKIIESAVVGVRKPDPRIFVLGVEALRLAPEEVLVVGDSYSKDILPARSIGCRTAWLKGAGWEKECDPEDDADVIQSISEITDAVL